MAPIKEKGDLKDDDCNNCDWAKSRMYVLSSLSKIEAALLDLSREFKEFKSEVRISMATRNGITKDDVDNMITAAVRRKKSSDELSKEDLEKVKEELHRSVQEHAQAEPSTWAPWKYVLLGAAIAVPGVLVEIAKIIK